MRRILLIENDATLRCRYRQTFEAEGYEILEADDYEAARAKLTESNLNLVVLELMLANGSGLELLQQIATNRRGLPVIINTAYEMLRFDFKIWAADAFVVKSHDLTELKDAVGQLLAKNQNVPNA